MKRRYILGTLVLLVLGSAYVYISFGSYREASTIGRASSFTELKAGFSELAERKGAQYAFEVLRRAKLPPGTDLHLLGHIVGDELYKQKGVDGIADCTQEFRNACSHTIVIGALSEYGDKDAFPLIRAACKKAPGGQGAYTMCYHGLGHGVLAYYGYELGPTVGFCRKTGTDAFGQREYKECIGGAIMELVGGGFHDRDIWLAGRAKYLVASDPLSPCSRDVIPEDAKALCYSYITPWLFELAGADMSAPGPKDFVKAFEMCDRIEGDQVHLRAACFSGVGKEFPVLALERDIRSLESASEEQLATMRAWCSLAPHAEAKNACIRSIVSSLYWGGENDSGLVIRFCNQEQGTGRSGCFSGILEEASMYAPVDVSMADFCAKMPEDVSGACREQLL